MLSVFKQRFIDRCTDLNDVQDRDPYYSNMFLTRCFMSQATSFGFQSKLNVNVLSCPGVMSWSFYYVFRSKVH